MIENINFIPDNNDNNYPSELKYKPHTQVFDAKRIDIRTNELRMIKDGSLAYGNWLRENCIVTRDGFRGSRVENWDIEMTNEEAYEIYLEGLKNKI
jgi:hypothetical protein